MQRLRFAALLALATAFIGGVALAAVPPVQTRTVAYDHVKLTYLDQGSGPAIVMIPSLGRGAHDFDDLAARVAAAGFRVLRLQPRGIDGSVGPMTGITLRDLASDVDHVIADSGAKRAVVLGHDDGNRIARATAVYFPGDVAAVVLVGCGGKSPPDREAAMALKATFDPSLAPYEHRQMVAVAFFAPGHDASVWQGGWYPRTADMERVAGRATPTDVWWTSGHAPLLVVQGRQDRIAPPQNAEMLKADVGARAEVHYIDGAGHALLPEQPEKLAAILIDYLKRRPAAD
jgi:pimeloyl-ACP methyl ester carboxylesterase